MTEREAASPGARRVKIGEALCGELRSVLGGAEQAFRIGVVVAHPRARVRGLDAQPVGHRQHGRGLQRGAVVPVQHRLVEQRCNALGQRRAFDQVGGVLGEVLVISNLSLRQR